MFVWYKSNDKYRNMNLPRLFRIIVSILHNVFNLTF